MLTSMFENKKNDKWKTRTQTYYICHSSIFLNLYISFTLCFFLFQDILFARLIASLSG